MHPFHLKTIVHHLMVMAVDIQEGNILIISIQEVVIQVVVEFILAGVRYILAVVGIVSHVK